MPATAKYLKNYSEPEALLLQSFKGHYQHAICLPIFNESTACLESLSKAAAEHGHKVLAIIVVNQSEQTLPTDQNLAFCKAITAKPMLWQNKHLSLHGFSHSLDVLLVKRFEPPLQLPSKQGVGLARKIAGDIASALWRRQQLSAPYFFSSDGDVTFPKNYFNAAFNSKAHSAACLAFTHQASENFSINKATKVYEKSLHDYRNNLEKAGSSYAFHTIGSCLVVAIDAYCQVRGFPKKAAGEDFYLLNKLNKIRPVQNLSTPIITIESRLSNRVPFGTGPAVEKLLNTPSTLFFHPQSFGLLKTYIDFLQTLAPQETALAAKALIKELPELCQGLAKAQNLEGFIEKLWQASPKPAQREKQITHWFDAFRTLKALHYFSEHGEAKLCYRDWLKSAKHIDLGK